MIKVFNGLAYNTDTAIHLCEIPCSKCRGDFGWHETSLYRTKKGAYFISGHGGPASIWRQAEGSNGWTSGDGLRVIDAEEARGYAEQAGLEVDEMIDAGFAVEEA